jgi:DNA-binding transcriptional LysR family regulator
VYTKQIKYFLTLAEVQSFRRAAELLSISQPALSNSIKNLEGEYQAELFERGPGGVRLTEFGRALYGFLRNASDSIERGRREVELIKKGSRGHLSIGAPTGLIDQLLPEVIARMSAASKGFSFGVRYGYLDALLLGVRGWQLDVLLTTYWPEAKLASDLIVEPFADLTLSIYCRASHPLVRKGEVTLADLSKAQWILPETGGMRSFVQDIFGAGHLSVVNRPITHDYPPFMIQMLKRMDLLSLIPDYVVADEVKSGALHKLQYAAFRPTLHAGVIYLRDRHMTPALQAFIRTAKEVGEARLGKGTSRGKR